MSTNGKTLKFRAAKLKGFTVVQNSDNDLVTSCFTRIWIRITCSLLLCFMLGSLAALINLGGVQEL